MAQDKKRKIKLFYYGSDTVGDTEIGPNVKNLRDLFDEKVGKNQNPSNYRVRINNEPVTNADHEINENDKVSITPQHLQGAK